MLKLKVILDLALKAIPSLLPKLIPKFDKKKESATAENRYNGMKKRYEAMKKRKGS